MRLKTQREWALVMGMLMEHVETLTRKLIMKDDVNLDLVRGELRAFVRLHDIVEDAPKLLAESRQPKT